LIPGGGATLTGFTFFAFSDKVLEMINVLAKDTRLNVLSSPSILTSENKKATINVSRSIPIVTSQTTPTAGAAGVATNTVEYKDAGIVLTVTPRIGEKRTVALDIKQEVNDVGAQIPPSNSPEIIKREADTSVVIADGQTLIMGGLIQTNKTFGQTGIPFLNKIPLFGLLFGSTTSKLTKTELVILITPRVVGTPEEGKKLTEEMRQRTPDLKKATEDAPKTPSVPPIPPPSK
jgi:general secretion pathway protein D